MEKEQKYKKKNIHHFEIFISKVLKNISDSKGGITSNAKQQLNSFLYILTKDISYKSLELAIYGKKKTISCREIKSSVEILLPGYLLENSISEGEKAITEFKNSNKKGTRQNKADIIFPPSMVEKFLRNFGFSKIMITKLASVYLAAILEYITYEILDLALNNCKENKRARITIRDIVLIVKNDIDLSFLVNTLNLSFLGGGVVPYIHPSLLKKNKIRNVKTKNSKKNKKLKCKTNILRDIKKYQKMSDHLIFSKSAFEKFTRYIFKDVKTYFFEKEEKEFIQFKISKEVFIILQYFIEQYIVKILYNANFMAIHAGRVKLVSVDIAFITYLLDNLPNPYTPILDDIQTEL